MSVKDGLLALLAGSPGYGYQLKTEFEDATGGAWTLNIGQVYTSLQRLERDGLVEEVDADEEGRRSYAVTAAGREHLAGWLAEPVPRSLEARDEVVMKILLAVVTPGHDPRTVIASQRDATMRVLQDQTRRKTQQPPPALAESIQLDRLILTCRAELDWLDLAEQRLDAVGNGHRADPVTDRPATTTTTTTTTTSTAPLAPKGGTR